MAVRLMGLLYLAVLPGLCPAAQKLSLVTDRPAAIAELRRQIDSNPNCRICRTSLGTALALDVLGATAYSPESGLIFRPESRSPIARQELEFTRDIRVLLGAGRFLTAWSKHYATRLFPEKDWPERERELSSFGLSLVDRAATLDPRLYDPATVWENPEAATWSEDAPTESIPATLMTKSQVQGPAEDAISLARFSMQGGAIPLELNIDTDGRVARIRLLRGMTLSELDVIDAYLDCRFRPVVRHGKPVQVRTQIEWQIPAWDPTVPPPAVTVAGQ